MPKASHGQDRSFHKCILVSKLWSFVTIQPVMNENSSLTVRISI